jgi:hypothetical protein
MYVSPSSVLTGNPLCVSQRTAKETARNDSCVVTIVGYRGNRVASLPIWLTVASLAISVPVGGSYGRLPHTIAL